MQRSELLQNPLKKLLAERDEAREVFGNRNEQQDWAASDNPIQKITSIILDNIKFALAEGVLDIPEDNNILVWRVARSFREIEGLAEKDMACLRQLLVDEDAIHEFLPAFSEELQKTIQLGDAKRQAFFRRLENYQELMTLCRYACRGFNHKNIDLVSKLEKIAKTLEVMWTEACEINKLALIDNTNFSLENLHNRLTRQLQAFLAEISNAYTEEKLENLTTLKCRWRLILRARLGVESNKQREIDKKISLHFRALLDFDLKEHLFCAGRAPLFASREDAKPENPVLKGENPSLTLGLLIKIADNWEVSCVERGASKAVLEKLIEIINEVALHIEPEDVADILPEEYCDRIRTSILNDYLVLQELQSNKTTLIFVGALANCQGYSSVRTQDGIKFTAVQAMIPKKSTSSFFDIDQEGEFIQSARSLFQAMKSRHGMQENFFLDGNDYQLLGSFLQGRDKPEDPAARKLFRELERYVSALAVNMGFVSASKFTSLGYGGGSDSE
ncbi:MAG TPA: hypothetical protein VLI69_02765 [Gammaproteobacteria bacterium]|nr:hypothetical protein [Gammaproteobacteria bacterium]